MSVQLLQRAADALAGRIFLDAEAAPHLRQGLVFKISQQHGAPIFLSQGGQRLVQHRRHLLPQGVRRGSFDFRLHSNLLLVLVAFGGSADLGQRGKAGRIEKPAAQRRLVGKLACLLGEDDKHRLRDFLGQLRIAHLPQGGGINEADAPVYQRFKGRFGTAGGILPQQLYVIHCLHLLTNVVLHSKPDIVFAAENARGPLKRRV